MADLMAASKVCPKVASKGGEKVAPKVGSMAVSTVDKRVACLAAY